MPLIVSAAKLAPKCAQKTVLLTYINKLLNIILVGAALAAIIAAKAAPTATNTGIKPCPDQKNMYLFVLKTGRKGIPEVLAPVWVVPKS